MTRAERRRLERENNKKDKTYTLTQAQIDTMKQDAIKEAIDVSFILMLYIPLKKLAEEHWKKSAAKSIPKFAAECIKTYEDIGNDKITINEIVKETEKLANIKMSELREVYQWKY